MRVAVVAVEASSPVQKRASAQRTKSVLMVLVRLLLLAVEPIVTAMKGPCVSMGSVSVTVAMVASHAPTV